MKRTIDGLENIREFLVLERHINLPPGTDAAVILEKALRELRSLTEFMRYSSK